MKSKFKVFLWLVMVVGAISIVEGCGTSTTTPATTTNNFPTVNVQN